MGEEAIDCEAEAGEEVVDCDSVGLQRAQGRGFLGLANRIYLDCGVYVGLIRVGGHRSRMRARGEYD